jgi:hypothetical protein
MNENMTTENKTFEMESVAPFARRGLNICSLFPLLWIIAFGAFILRVRLVYGHWLSSNDWVSETFHFPIHDSLIVLTTILAVLSAPFWLLFLILEANAYRNKCLTRWPVLVPWLGIIAFIVLNPRGLFTWFLD